MALGFIDKLLNDLSLHMLTVYFVMISTNPNQIPSLETSFLWISNNLCC